MASAADNQVNSVSDQPLGGRPRFVERFKRGWREANACWNLISKDPYLLILPGVSLVFVWATWGGLYLAISAFVDPFYLRFLLTVVLTAYPTSFVGTFLGVAFVAVADARLRGQGTTVAQGLSTAKRKTGAIARWALISAGFGLLLQLLQHVKADWAASAALTWIAGAAWSVLTFFVVPVLAFEDTGARGSLRRSAQIVRERWGEGLGGVTNLGAVFVVAMLGLIVLDGVLAAIGFSIGLVPGIVAIVIVGLLFVCAFAALSAGGRLLAIGLYRFATGGPMVGFDQQVLQEALIPRRRRWWPWRRR